MLKNIILLLILLAFPVQLFGKIVYDQEINSIIVTGYPEDNPATLERILEADKKNNWDKVSFDKTSGVYKINANLRIGDKSNISTRLQIGTPDNSKETLIMKGTIWVVPAKDNIKRKDGRYGIANGLQMGSQNNKKITATLKFDCKRNSVEYGLCVGSPQNPRGCLKVYNSEITVLDKDQGGRWSAVYYKNPNAENLRKEPRITQGCNGSEIILKNSRFSYFTSMSFYGGVDFGVSPSKRGKKSYPMNIKPNPLAIVENCVFENGQGSIFSPNRIGYFRNCIFKNSGGLGCGKGLKAVNCRFLDLKSDWSGRKKDTRGAVFIDCDFGDHEAIVSIRKNTSRAWFVIRYPSCDIIRSLLIKVVDSSGKPVPDAVVNVACETFPEAVIRGITMTDKNGETGKDPEKNSLLVVTKMYKATDEPLKPKIINKLAYSICVKKGNSEKKIKISSEQKILDLIVIKLKQ